jgi:hypothetical protein
MALSVPGKDPFAGATDLPLVALLGAANAPIVDAEPVDLQNRGQETP